MIFLSNKQENLIVRLFDADNIEDALKLLQSVEHEVKRPKTLRSMWTYYRTPKEMRECYADIKYCPANFLMWAYYFACKWYDCLNGELDDAVEKTINSCRSEWELDDWKNAFDQEVQQFALWLRDDFVKRRVRHMFSNVREHYDMMPENQQLCEMLYCVNDLFTNHGDSCLPALQRAGWVVDCKILDELWAENGSEMLSAIKKHAQDDAMSIPFVICACYVLQNWVSLLDEQDPVATRVFEESDYEVYEWYRFFKNELIRVSMDEFVRWMAEFKVNKEKYQKMLPHIDPHVLGDIMKTAVNLRKNA